MVDSFISMDPAAEQNIKNHRLCNCTVYEHCNIDHALGTGLQAPNRLPDQVLAAEADNAALLCVFDCPLQDTALPIMRSPSSSRHYEAQGSNLRSGNHCPDLATQQRILARAGRARMCHCRWQHWCRSVMIRFEQAVMGLLWHRAGRLTSYSNRSFAGA